MLNVYINYPNPKISVYENDIGNSTIKKNGKKNQRVLSINYHNYKDVIETFNVTYKFAANKDENDIWIDIDSGNASLDKSILSDIAHELSIKYKPFRDDRIVYN